MAYIKEMYTVKLTPTKPMDAPASPTKIKTINTSSKSLKYGVNENSIYTQATPVNIKLNAKRFLNF